MKAKFYINCPTHLKQCQVKKRKKDCFVIVNHLWVFKGRLISYRLTETIMKGETDYFINYIFYSL